MNRSDIAFNRPKYIDKICFNAPYIGGVFSLVNVFCIGMYFETIYSLQKFERKEKGANRKRLPP
ncbi:MAG: hypothetical protein C0394_07370 [Syntrophus sp. (in: bacteria)]|nr:hypothetical protein [Syntrophus sp. (in: bacteria)]